MERLKEFELPCYHSFQVIPMPGPPTDPTSGDLSVRPLNEHDLDFVDLLVAEAGWNQLRSDWRRILRCSSDGCFAGFIDGRLVGTVTTTTYGQDLGWIGMMLVHPSYRRRGVASALMSQSLEYLRERVHCIKLDATPEGRLVYEQLGFEVEWDFFRWIRDSAAASSLTEPDALPVPSHSWVPAEIERVMQLDQIALGVNRSKLLKELGAASRVVTAEDGFGMTRLGRLAGYLGPVIARNGRFAESLLTELINPIPGQIFWDVPGPNQLASEIARRLSFRPERKLTRMRLGRMAVEPVVELQFAIAGPETG